MRPPHSSGVPMLHETQRSSSQQRTINISCCCLVRMVQVSLILTLLSSFTLCFGSIPGNDVSDTVVPLASAVRANLRGRRLLDDSRSWRDKVKEKGETVFQEKKRAAIRAACYKDWYELTVLLLVTSINYVFRSQETRVQAHC
jgi:hypothetical protein